MKRKKMCATHIPTKSPLLLFHPSTPSCTRARTRIHTRIYLRIYNSNRVLILVCKEFWLASQNGNNLYKFGYTKVYIDLVKKESNKRLLRENRDNKLAWTNWIRFLRFHLFPSDFSKSEWYMTIVITRLSVNFCSSYRTTTLCICHSED